MASDRLGLCNAPRTEPLPQPIDECCAAFRTAGLGCRCKVGLCRLHTFGDRDGKVQRLEAEAGIEVMCGGALELQFEEARDMLGAARRHGQPDVNRLDLAINAVERKPQGTRPYAIAHQSMNEILHQAGRNRDDDLLRKNRFKQIAQAVIDRRGSDGGKRLVYTAERLVETPEQLTLETRGER